MTKRALLVMAKRPAPGQTKTRLMPVLSAREAAALYECFLQDTLELARALPGVTPFIAYAPPTPDAAAYFQTVAPDFELVPQAGDTLGERLDNVLSHCLDLGFMRVAAMNSDGPTLPKAYLESAFKNLDDPHTDLVLGPSDDGGYYLIGWKRPHARLVRDVRMSTDRVLQDTLAIAEKENLRVALLPPWYDVDEAADLERLQTDLSAGATHTRQFLRQMRASSQRLQP